MHKTICKRISLINQSAPVIFFRYQLSPSSAFGEDYFDDVAAPSAQSKERILHDNIPLMEKESESSNIGGDVSFRQRLSFGSSTTETRASEKINNTLELSSLGSRGPKPSSDPAEKSNETNRSGQHVPPPPVVVRRQLSDFQTIEFV